MTSDEMAELVDRGHYVVQFLGVPLLGRDTPRREFKMEGLYILFMDIGSEPKRSDSQILAINYGDQSVVNSLYQNNTPLGRLTWGNPNVRQQALDLLRKAMVLEDLSRA